MYATILVLFTIVAVSLGFAPSSRVARQTAIKAIPSFNWPGSIVPPSNLEALFGRKFESGGAKKVAAPAAPPAPVKKASPFGSFGKKADVKPAAAPVKGKVVAKPAVKAAAKPVAKPAAKVAAKPAGKVTGKPVAKAAPAPAKKGGLFGFGGK